VREFVVTLHSGKKYTVRADRVTLTDPTAYSLLIDTPGSPAETAVAVFGRGCITCVIAADHLVGEADVPDVVAADPNADIPF
jgi:hypothetical protein